MKRFAGLAAVAMLFVGSARAEGPAPCQRCPSPCPTPKVCVVEPKHNTKTVYCCKCEEYCIPRPSLRFLFGDCGEPCCEKRTRVLMVKRKVPTCDTLQCVAKEVPVAEPAKPAGK